MAAQIQLGVIVVTLVVGFCLLDVIFWILAARALNKPVDPQVLEQERRSAPPVTDPRRLRNFLPILAFTLVWTTVFGAIDAALCFTIMQQVRALNYATVEGQIVRSRLVPKSNPDDGWQ